MALISIVTTVYNNEKYIKSAINSVLCQKFSDLEYIIIDDGSTDGTPQILDEIALADDRIRVIHQKNQWIYAGFNNGIKAANGEYIYILNSDDILNEGSLNKFESIIEKYHPDVIYTPIMIHKCDKDQNILVYDRLNLKNLVEQDEFWDREDSYRNNWLKLDKLKLTANQANLYKRELMLQHPFRNDVYGADYLFNISIAEDIHSAYVMKEPVYNFFEYGIEGMNASVGKYYEYQHSMFNEFYEQNKRLLQKWGRYDEEAAKFCIRKRLANYSHELKSLLDKNCKLSLEDKLRKIFYVYIEDWIYDEVKTFGLEEEFESRTLSGVRELLCHEKLNSKSDMYFLYDLLDGLLKYEKTETDYIKIKEAIYNEGNPLNIGKTFYDKISDGERFKPL